MKKNGSRHAASALMLSLALGALLCSATVAQELQGPPAAAGRVAELFPETSGAFSLRERVTASLPEFGTRFINYDVLLGEKKVGEVTRILPLAQDGPSADVDLLVRYDDKGAVRGVTSLKPWRRDADAGDLPRLLGAFTGRDLRSDQARLSGMIAGISAGAAMADGMAAPSGRELAPAKVRQLLLEPGAQLPPLKVTDLNGAPFDAASRTPSKLLISFLSPDNPRSGDMARAIEAGAARELADQRVALIHIISAPADQAAGYAGAAGLRGRAAADPAGLLARMFRAPYTPYLFMFEGGTLAAPVAWEGEERLGAALRRFLHGAASGAKGGAK